MGDRLCEQLASHEALLETRGTQACEQVEIAEAGDLADEGVQIARKGHPTRPGAGDGEVLEEWEEFKCMRAVGLYAIPVGRFGRVQLPVAADDYLAIAGLPPVEVAGEPSALVMSQFERCLLVTGGMAVPVEVRLERSDAVKDAGRHGSGGPHLAAHSIHGDGETEQSTQGATPRPSIEYERAGSERCGWCDNVIGAIIKVCEHGGTMSFCAREARARAVFTGLALPPCG